MSGLVIGGRASDFPISNEPAHVVQMYLPEKKIRGNNPRQRWNYLMGDLDMSDAALSTKLGVTRAAVSLWRMGKTVASPFTQAKMAQFIGVSVEDIALLFNPTSRSGKKAGAPARAGGSPLSLLRIARGWTQRELGHKINVTCNCVAQWEHGKSVPRSQHLRALTDVLGLRSIDAALALFNKAKTEKVK